jgi:hypothetical protein
MSRNNYYRGRQGGRNQPSWGRNSNYRNERQGGYPDEYNNDWEYSGNRNPDFGGHNNGRNGEGRGSHGYGGNQDGRHHYGSSRAGSGGSGWQNRNDYYNNTYRSAGRGYGGYREEDDDRNFFERAGDRIRDAWNDRTDRDDDRDYRNYSDRQRSNQYRGYRSGGYEDQDDRNIFERAGDKIREKWNDWRHGDDDERDYSPQRRGWASNDSPDYNERNFGQRNNRPYRDQYPSSGYNSERGFYEDPNQFDNGRHVGRRRQREEEYSY